MTKTTDYQDHDWLIEPIALVFIIIVSCFGGAFIGSTIRRDGMREEAVAAGAGEYYLDKAGVKQFRYFDVRGEMQRKR